MPGVPVGRELVCPAHHRAGARVGIAEWVSWDWIQSRTILQGLELELVQERNLFLFFRPPLLPSYLGYFWTCAFFVTWKLKTDELVQYEAYSWKLQLLQSECQPACWWAHLLDFICFVIQIFLRPFLSIYSQSSCTISVWVQMANVLLITFLSVTWILWDKSWLLPFVSHANTELFYFARLMLGFRQM